MVSIEGIQVQSLLHLKIIVARQTSLYLQTSRPHYVLVRISPIPERIWGVDVLQVLDPTTTTGEFGLCI